MKNIVMIETPEHVQIPFETAGIATRSFAKIIDFIVIAAILFPLSGMTAVVGVLADDPGGELPSVVVGILIFVSAAIPLVYFTVSEYWLKGQTLGKRLLGLRVIQDDGRNPGFLTIFLRNALLIADFFPALFLFGMLSVFLHRQEKRLGDMVAGTLVIREQKIKNEVLVLERAQLMLTSQELGIFRRLPPLSGERYLILESFLLRRGELEQEARRHLVGRMLNWWPEIVVIPGHEEEFLEKIYLYFRQTAYPSHLPRVYPAATSA
jgi:uncharacterized RDD family membrane protein YckC